MNNQPLIVDLAIAAVLCLASFLLGVSYGRAARTEPPARVEPPAPLFTPGALPPQPAHPAPHLQWMPQVARTPERDQFEGSHQRTYPLPVVPHAKETPR